MAQQNTASLARLVTESVVHKMQRTTTPITSYKDVAEQVSEQSGLPISKWRVRKVIKEDLNMSYRPVTYRVAQTHTVRCMVLWQQYAMKMVSVLEQGFRVINLDESWLNWTHHLIKAWQPRGAHLEVSRKQLQPRVSVLAALDTAGRVWYSLSRANTTVETMRLFLSHLFGQLDDETPGWRQTTVMLMDGARYHMAGETRDYLDGEGVTYMYTAPYSP